MKITKTFIVVFLLTFLIGTISFYLLILKTGENVEQIEITQPIPSDSPAPKIETKIELEILEENDDWRDEHESKFKIKLLETGEGFHGNQIEAKSGETWLGLFKVKDKYFLRSTKIKIHSVHDSVIDGYEEKYATQKTGKSVIVSGKLQPVFLLKNAKQLKEGETKTLFWNNSNEESKNEEMESTSLDKKFIREYQFGEEKYILQVREGVNKKGEKILALIFEDDKKKQVLHSTKSIEEGDYLGSLNWVGDLDRDGKPDFYFDLYFHDNVEYKNLFISSEAKKGKLLKKVATFITTGC